MEVASGRNRSGVEVIVEVAAPDFGGGLGVVATGDAFVRYPLLAVKQSGAYGSGYSYLHRIRERYYSQFICAPRCGNVTPLSGTTAAAALLSLNPVGGWLDAGADMRVAWSA